MALPTTILPPEFDAGIFPGRRIGLVMLSSDQVGERAFGTIVEAAGAAYFTTRVLYRYTKADMPDQEDVDLAVATGQLLPEAGLDVLAYSCTSRSAQRGEQEMIDILQKARPGMPATTPLLAARTALSHLGARTIALVSPYKRNVHDAVAQACDKAGLHVTRSTTFDLSQGTDFARLAPSAIAQAAIDMVTPQTDAIFISCTGIRAVPIIAEVEAATGLPVVTSSQSLAWHALRLLDLDAPGPGRLFQQHRGK